MSTYSYEDKYGIAVAGLAFAGKTSIIRRLTTGKFVSVSTTQGVDSETIERANIKFLVFDLGGQDVYVHTLWKAFLQRADVLIYVVDASDWAAFNKARDLLQLALSWNRKIKHLLILANKQDLSAAAKEIEVLEKFELTRILTETEIQQFRIYGTSAKTGLGIEESFDWIAAQLTGQRTVPMINVRNVIVYQKTGLPVVSSQNPIAELARFDLAKSKDDVVMVSGFYSAMGSFTDKLFDGQIRSLEIKGPKGEMIKLVNVEREGYYCLLVVDSTDDTMTVEAIGHELLDYVITRKKGKLSLDEDKMHDILYPFLVKNVEFDSLKEAWSGSDIADKEAMEENPTNKEKSSEFFMKMSVMDRIKAIEGRKIKRQK